jgi:hypothetical protein
VLQVDRTRVSRGRLIAIPHIQLFSSQSMLARGCQSLLKHDAALCRLSKKSISGIRGFAIYLPV